MLNLDRFKKKEQIVLFYAFSIHIDNNCNHGTFSKKVRTLMLTFTIFKKVGLLYGRVGAGVAGATSKFLPGAA
jgi:hypothetical protein